MGYLGYDPAGLLRLRAFLEEAAVERARLRFDDPMSDRAGAVYRRAGAGVLDAAPRIDAILACAFGGVYRPVHLEVSLTNVDVLRLGDAAWTIVTDPGLADADPRLAAAHLGEYLASSGPADAFGVATADELSARLAGVAQGEGTAAAFVDAAGLEALAALVTALWRSVATPFDDRERQQAGVALAAIAAILGRAERDRPGTWGAFLESAMARSDHVDTALAVTARDAALPPSALRPTFAALSADSSARGEMPIYDADGHVRASTAGALADAVSAQPALANEIVRALDPSRFSWLLASGGEATGRLFVAATMPPAQSPISAGAAVDNVLARLAGRHDLVDARLRPWLGAMVAPWAALLVVLPRATTMPAWPFAAEPMAIAELRWILEADAAAALVTRWLLTVTPATASTLLATGPPDQLYDWAEQLGVLTARINQQQIRHARRELDRWRRGWKLPLAALNTIAMHALDLDAVTSFVATQVLAAVEDAALDRLADDARLGAPATIERVTVDEVGRFELVEATLVAAARRAVFERFVATGRLPPGAEPPPAVRVDGENPIELDTDAVRAWRVRMEPIVGTDTVAAVVAAGAAVQNGFARGRDEATHDPVS